MLEAAVDLYEFYHYHDMELNWINERLPIAHSTNCGKSLDVAQSLLQKHKVIPLIKCILACWHIAFHLSSPLPSGRPLQAKCIATLSMSTFFDSSTFSEKMLPVD